MGRADNSLFPMDESCGPGEEHRGDQSQHSQIWRRWANVISGASSERNDTQRGMQSRHLMMIGRVTSPDLYVGGVLLTRSYLYVAIGGTIGTGIFLSAGSVSLAPSPPFFFAHV